MATEAQLKALAKGRAALAKKRGTKSAKKVSTKKRATTKRKSNPTCRDYVVYVLHRGKRYYFTGAKLDTEISNARVYANKYAADAASEVLNAFGRKAAVTKK